MESASKNASWILFNLRKQRAKDSYETNYVKKKENIAGDYHVKMVALK